MLTKRRPQTKLEIVYDRALDEMIENPGTLQEEAERLDHVAKIHKMMMEDNSRRRVSPDTLATIAANLVGILIIIGYEQNHVITSKAATLVVKPR